MDLSPLPIQRFYSNIGLPLVGGKLFTYIAGTTTKIATYIDSSGLTQNTNPVVLNFRGECNLWLDATKTYKFVLAGPLDTDPPTNPIWSVDNISPAISAADLSQIIGPILYPQTTAEIAASITPSNYFYPVYDIRRYGASQSMSSSQNKAALQSAITVATFDTKAGSLGGVVITVPASCHYGYKVTTLSTYPQFSGTTPITVYDYSQGESYSGYPSAYDGSQVRIFFYTPQTSKSLTFTGSPLSGATSATITANFTGGPTGLYSVTFSNGDVRNVTFTNGATTATWSPGLSSNSTANITYINPSHDGNGQRIIGNWAPYQWIDNASGIASPSVNGLDNRRALQFYGVDGQGFWSIGQGGLSGSGFTVDALTNFAITCYATTTKSLTFTGSLLGGATSATLAAPFSDPSGTYTVIFSDSETRVVTLTNGATTATWTGGLSGGVTSAANYQSAGSALLNNYVPMLIERITGNIGFGIGANSPQASYWFKSVSSGFAQAYFESLSATSQIFLRTSNGSAQDVGFINRGGQACINISAQGDAISFDLANRRASFGAAMQLVRQTPAAGTAFTPDAGVGNAVTLTVNAAGAVTVNAPTTTPSAALPLFITVRNTSGGVTGAFTWNAIFKMAAWGTLAANTARSIAFIYDVANSVYYEISRTPVDTPL